MFCQNSQEMDGMNDQTRVCNEAYSSLNFSGSLGKYHQLKSSLITDYSVFLY
jgi:hypothetical protein